jgi:hypothetical protein
MPLITLDLVQQDLGIRKVGDVGYLVLLVTHAAGDADPDCELLLERGCERASAFSPRLGASRYSDMCSDSSKFWDAK